MADTLRIGQHDADGDDAPADAGGRAEESSTSREAEDKQVRPAGLRLQVFTPPPFDEGPLWGTNPDTTPVDAPEAPSEAASWTVRHRPALRAAALAAIGALLVTVGMLISKLHGTAESASSGAVPVVGSVPAAINAELTAVGSTTRTAGDAAVLDAAPSVSAVATEPVGETSPRSSGPVAATGGAPNSEDEVEEPPDASAAAVVEDSAAGKTLILTDAPF